MRAMIGIVLGAIGGGAGLYGWTGSEPRLEHEVDFVRRATIERVVLVNGTLAPRHTVTVGSELSGRIAALHADFNDQVMRDEVIARIDAQTFVARVQQARAEVKVAEASIAQRRAERERAVAERAQAERSLERRKRLLAQGHATDLELDQEETRLAMADAEVGVADALTRGAEALLEQRQAALALAELDLERTFIRSPVAGTVIRRSIEVGQTVAASLQAPELFEIAADMTRMKVEANVDEADIGLVQEGMPCRFQVDAFPERVFEGRIEQIRKAAETVLNVVTYKVVISTSNEEGILLPGMTANIAIVTAQRHDVLVVPNAALRIVPRGGLAPPAAAQAVQGEERSAHVWQLVHGELKPVRVAIGLADDDHTEVTAGLSESDPVVVRARPDGS